MVKRHLVQRYQDSGVRLAVRRMVQDFNYLTILIIFIFVDKRNNLSYERLGNVFGPTTSEMYLGVRRMEVRSLIPLTRF